MSDSKKSVYIRHTFKKLDHEPFDCGGTADPSFSAMLKCCSEEFRYRDVLSELVLDLHSI